MFQLRCLLYWVNIILQLVHASGLVVYGTRLTVNESRLIGDGSRLGTNKSHPIFNEFKWRKIAEMRPGESRQILLHILEEKQENTSYAMEQGVSIGKLSRATTPGVEQDEAVKPSRNMVGRRGEPVKEPWEMAEKPKKPVKPLWKIAASKPGETNYEPSWDIVTTGPQPEVESWGNTNAEAPAVEPWKPVKPLWDNANAPAKSWDNTNAVLSVGQNETVKSLDKH